MSLDGERGRKWGSVAWRARATCHGTTTDSGLRSCGSGLTEGASEDEKGEELLGREGTADGVEVVGRLVFGWSDGGKIGSALFTDEEGEGGLFGGGFRMSTEMRTDAKVEVGDRDAEGGGDAQEGVRGSVLFAPLNLSQEDRGDTGVLSQFAPGPTLPFAMAPNDIAPGAQNLTVIFCSAMIEHRGLRPYNMMLWAYRRMAVRLRQL